MFNFVLYNRLAGSNPDIEIISMLLSYEVGFRLILCLSQDGSRDHDATSYV